jgi:hypothetical protein
VRLEVGPAEVHIVPGQPAAVVAQVFNTDDVINAYEIRVFGVDPTWVELERERLSLFPSSAGVVNVSVNVPEDYPAGTLRLGIEVTPIVAPDERQLGEVAVIVPPRRIATVVADPVTQIAGRKALFNLTFTNEGNAPISLDLSAVDPEAKVRTTFVPPQVEVVPGEQVIVGVRTQARPPIMGNAVPRLVTLKATGADNPLESLVSFVQKPILGRSLISLFGLLMAVSVFAIVLTSTLGRVVDVSKVDAALLKRAIEGAPDKAGVPDNPGSVTGRVTLRTSGAGVAGVTVELFPADDGSKPVASSATGDDGTYTLGSLNEGSYKVRYRGAGFTELWFDEALTFEDAKAFDVKLGKATPGIDIAIGGIPGSIAGTVLADDAKDAKVTLQVPAAALAGSTDAELQSVVAGADGTFLLEKVPAPSSYELVVSKPGYTTVTRVVNLGAGEAMEGVEIRMRRGDGLISGHVTDDDDVPLGGVTITATNAADSLTTTSLTTGDVGSFSLRNLPTPGTYTIAFAKDGFATENLTIALEQAEQQTGIAVTLAKGTGSIAGEVRLEGEGPLGGVTVTVNDSETTVTTETLSVGLIGSYLVNGLPVPGTYTVTFSGPGLATQVRSVDLDALGNINATGVNATLTAATATVSGTVKDPSGPASGVDVELSDGTTTLTTRTADDPAGEYVIPDVPPGTYTLTFRRTGAVPRSVLLTVGAGEARTVDVSLDPQASISGTVRRIDGTATAPLAGAQVLVYLVDQFPNVVAATATTAADGTYTITDLAAPEEYIVEFAYPSGAVPQQSTRVVLNAGEQRTLVDASIKLVGDAG